MWVLMMGARVFRRSWVPVGVSLEGGGFPIATIAIIAINSVLYLLTSYKNMLLSINSDALWTYGYIPAYLYTAPENGILRIFTSMFLHADPLHIFFNMYFLYIFGRGVEGVLGVGRYLALYLLSGVWASLLHTASVGFQGVASISIPAVGASGAISGILGAFLVLYPRTPLSMCFFYIFIPICGTFRASTFLLFWFAIQVIYGYLRLGGIAFLAHAGGFIAGMALTWLLGGGVIARLKQFSAPSWNILGILGEEGIGGAQKAVLAGVLISIIAMGFYSYVSGSSIDRLQLTYVVSVRISSSEKDPPYSLSVATLSIRDISDFTMSPIADDASRILINRLVASGVLFNPQMSNKEGSISGSYSVSIYGVRVPFTISARASYDGNGVLAEARGSASTASVICSGSTCARGDTISYPWFDLRSSGPIQMVKLIETPLLLSIAITILGLYVIIARDRELSLGV